MKAVGNGTHCKSGLSVVAMNHLYLVNIRPMYTSARPSRDGWTFPRTTSLLAYNDISEHQNDLFSVKESRDSSPSFVKQPF